MNLKRLSRLPYCTLLLAFAVVLIALRPATTEAFQLDRQALAAGEGWRLFTGHLTHFGWNHLVWDLTVFVGLGSCCEPLGRLRFLVGLGLSMAFVSISVLWLQPQFAVYRGLSGVDSALYGAACAHLLLVARRNRDRVLGLVTSAALLGFALKTVFELRTGAVIFTDNTTQPFEAVPLAHLVGALTGIALVVIWEIPRWHLGEAEAAKQPSRGYVA